MSAHEHLYNLVTGRTKGPLAVFLRAFLFVLSFFYGLVVTLLAGFYRIKPYRFKAKVISVGNVTLGGTGKTTLVEYLAGLLKIQKRKIVILSRGYKNADEPAMLQKKLPYLRVIVDSDRIRSGSKAIRDDAADTLILDDGFQQWRIFKDLEIVAVDAKDPFGNGRLLPAGFLREPLFSLKRADIFLLTQVDGGQDISILYNKLKRINPKALIFESIHEPESFNDLLFPEKIFNLDAFKGRSALLFSGIGNPQGFEDSIRSLGLKISDSLRYADHHDYAQKDIDRILETALRLNTDIIVTTQKDAVKAGRFDLKNASIAVLNIKLKIIKNEEEFNSRLFKLFSL